MPSRLGFSVPTKRPVLSLFTRAEAVAPQRKQGQFEVLVRHLLHRFLHNELLASDDETKRVMQISYAVALPGLLFAMYLFPAYHGFPPFPFPRPFWTQVGDHYFYVMYAFVLMGAATIYEWDLLFPDLLDIFVLSILPVSYRRLFFARVLALAIFLGLVLCGTSIFGILVLPLIAELANPFHHLLAHTTAIAMSGSFAALAFLSLQGILLNVLGERFFRRITPLLQGGSLLLMLTILLLYPTLAHVLEPLFRSGSLAVRYFPPFWFLGVYERILDGPSAPAIFGQLARTGSYALLTLLGCTLATYPLAYHRRVRQVVEGGQTKPSLNPASVPLNRLMEATFLREPAQRAVFHFISQTVLRSQRHRVMLALYGGLGLALALSNLVVLHVSGSHIRLALVPYGVRAAVPIIAFWTVVGLTSVIKAPVDRRGTWVFRVLVGHASVGHLEGARFWVTSWSILLSVATALLLHVVAPPELRSLQVGALQLLVAVSASVLLSECMLYATRTLPLTTLHKSSITDFPLMILRYVVGFPVLVAVILHYEPSLESSPLHLVGGALVLLGAHQLLRHVHSRSLLSNSLDHSPDEAEDFPQSLGLRDT